jgi:hypothetical protein
VQFISPLRHCREVYATRARELHLWLLEVLAWLMARVPAPRSMKLELRRDLRKTRREIRILIMLSMISRLRFNVDAPSEKCAPPAALGYRRRRTRLIHAITRGIPLRTPREMRETLENFDKVVMRAIARLPKKGAVRGAVVTVTAVAIALCTTAPAPAAQAADTS